MQLKTQLVDICLATFCAKLILVLVSLDSTLNSLTPNITQYAHALYSGINFYINVTFCTLRVIVKLVSEQNAFCGSWSLNAIAKRTTRPRSVPGGIEFHVNDRYCRRFVTPAVRDVWLMSTTARYHCSSAFDGRQGKFVSSAWIL